MTRALARYAAAWLALLLVEWSTRPPALTS